MLNLGRTTGWGVLCLNVLLCSGMIAFAAQDPAHEQEANKTATPQVQLSVPEKKWLGRELFTTEPGHYSVLIWGHAETARAMPPQFDVDEEVRYLVQHHIDWYSVGTPKNDKAAEKYQRYYQTTGLRVAIGFPHADAVAEAIEDGASPSNPSEVKEGKKPKIAPIDPHYVAVSARVVDEQFGPKADLDWVRAVHFQDEPNGEMPYYDIGPQSDMALAKDWDTKVRETFGAGKWGLPASNWDITVPQSRLAFQKFWSKEFNNYQRTMAEGIRKYHPKLPIWSANFWFNLWADLLVDYGEMGGFLDAIVVDSYATQQEVHAPGRGRWNAGFVTKIVGDFSHRPVYNHIQVLRYHGATPTPTDIREYASQVLRAGGQGIIYYAVDMPEYKYIRYTDPARWSEMMEIGDELHSLPRLKLPAHAMTGIWVSQETLATTGPRVKDNDAYAAYVLFGETLGAPFRYVSDWGVERKGASELDGLKILYAANARFVPAGVPKKLAGWVRNGGVLVLTAPDSFTQQIDGTSLESWKLALGADGKPVDRDHFQEWTLGRGKVLVLKETIWNMGVWTDAARVQEVRAFQKQFDGGLDEPIWRFRLPKTQEPQPTVKENAGTDKGSGKPPAP